MLWNTCAYCLRSLDLLQILKQEDKLHFDIIFVTAHTQFDYAVRALAFSALDFLTKPIQREKLREAVHNAFNSQKTREQFRKQLEMLFQMGAKGGSPETVCIPLLKGELAFIPFHEIAYLESQTEVTRIQLQTGESMLAMRNIGYFDKILIPDLPFFRISQKIIVNVPYVRRYNHQELKVILKNGTSLDASRQGGRDFRRYFLEQEPPTPNKEFLAFIRRWLGNGKG